jgi:hypothetical protein
VSINVRFPPADLAEIDAWIEAQPDAPSRPEAIRRLVNKALSVPALPDFQPFDASQLEEWHPDQQEDG